MLANQIKIELSSLTHDPHQRLGQQYLNYLREYGVDIGSISDEAKLVYSTLWESTDPEEIWNLLDELAGLVNGLQAEKIPLSSSEVELINTPIETSDKLLKVAKEFKETGFKAKPLTPEELEKYDITQEEISAASKGISLSQSSDDPFDSDDWMSNDLGEIDPDSYQEQEDDGCEGGACKI